MADGSTSILLPVPPEALVRLRRAEARQRNETKQRGLTAVPVSVEGLLLIQRFKCGCGCGDPLDFNSAWDEKSPPPGYPVIAHRLARGSRGEHTPRNLGIDRHACNKRDASPDTSGAASVRRFSPDFTKKVCAVPPPDQQRSGWGKRGLQSRGFDKTRSKKFSGEVVKRG